MNAERVSVCGCVWRHFPEATQGWKWKCVKRCPDHDASAGHVSPLGSCCGRTFYTWEGYAKHLEGHRAASRPAADTAPKDES